MIAVLQLLDVENKQCQAIFLAPTREAVQTIHSYIVALGEYRKIESTVFVGVVQLPWTRSESVTRRGASALLVPPGRVLVMLQRGLLTPDSVQQVVLTDADEMVSRGSVVQICNVLRLLPGAVARVLQIILLSNTMPSDVLEAARRFMHRPIQIVVANACARVAERVDAAEASKETGGKTEW